MISQPKTYVKAIWSTAVAIIGGLAIVLVGDVTPADLTWGQWITLVGSALAAFGGTYGFSNQPATPTRARHTGGTTGDL